MNAEKREVKISTTGHCGHWGASKSARRVSGLLIEERAAIRSGESVFIDGAPLYQGTTLRRVVEINHRFYARMP